MGKNPKLGDDIVDPPGHQVVTHGSSMHSQSHTDGHSSTDSTTNTTDSPASKAVAQASDAVIVAKAVVAEAQADLDKALAAEADAVAKAAAAAEDAVPKPNILLESGVRRAMPKDFTHAFRVYDAQAKGYEHVAIGPEGEWVYRPIA